MRDTRREFIDMTQLMIEADQTCTGITETCPDEECLACSVRDCPEHEPLHYHHDGCPACETKES